MNRRTRTGPRLGGRERAAGARRTNEHEEEGGALAEVVDGLERRRREHGGLLRREARVRARRPERRVVARRDPRAVRREALLGLVEDEVIGEHLAVHQHRQVELGAARLLRLEQLQQQRCALARAPRHELGRAAALKSADGQRVRVAVEVLVQRRLKLAKARLVAALLRVVLPPGGKGGDSVGVASRRSRDGRDARWESETSRPHGDARARGRRHTRRAVRGAPA
eukprot:5334945-Prymnesium_polylepis.1